MIPDNEAHLIAAVAQAILYGAYLVSLAHALRWLLYEDEDWELRPMKKVNRPILTIAFLVFLLSTTDVGIAISVQRKFYGLNAAEPVAREFVAGGVVVESITLILIDAVLITRCWFVYEKSWRVIVLPLLCWLANIASTILFLIYFLAPPSSDMISFSLSSIRTLQVIFICNFATNFYATVAIVHRIWHVARTTNAQSSMLYTVCRIIAGTGILYTSTNLPLVVTSFELHRNRFAYVLCSNINFSIAGITFNLLLIRTGQLRAGQDINIVSSEHESIVLTTLHNQGASTSTSTGDRLLDPAGCAPRRKPTRDLHVFVDSKEEYLNTPTTLSSSNQTCVEEKNQPG